MISSFIKRAFKKSDEIHCFFKSKKVIFSLLLNFPKLRYKFKWKKGDKNRLVMNFVNGRQ